MWNKVPIKLQKEVGQLTEGSLQELFQKLLKVEEIVRERERRSSSLRGSATREFRNKASYRVPAQNTNYTSGQQKEDGKTRFQQESLRNIDVGRKVMLPNLVVLLLIRFVLNHLTRVNTWWVNMLRVHR